ncbi:MAG: hypothetical protein ACI8TP_002581 [Acidimicrobiales bacterium]|jgi:hypothetical protein
MAKSSIDYCEHDEIAVACLDCMAMPQKVAPRPKPKEKATKSPASDKDLIAPLSGSLDISIPVSEPDQVIGNNWVSAHAFPHDLRRSGWVYLRTSEALVARAKAKKVEWRNERVLGEKDAGGGMVIIVDPESWDASIDIELGWLAERQTQGYRYLQAQEDGSVIHFSGGKPVEEAIDDEDLDAETSPSA